MFPVSNHRSTLFFFLCMAAFHNLNHMLIYCNHDSKRSPNLNKIVILTQTTMFPLKLTKPLTTVLSHYEQNYFFNRDSGKSRMKSCWHCASGSTWTNNAFCHFIGWSCQPVGNMWSYGWKIQPIKFSYWTTCCHHDAICTAPVKKKQTTLLVNGQGLPPHIVATSKSFPATTSWTRQPNHQNCLFPSKTQVVSAHHSPFLLMKLWSMPSSHTE